jgi:hypothetical protein
MAIGLAEHFGPRGGMEKGGFRMGEHEAIPIGFATRINNFHSKAW